MKKLIYLFLLLPFLSYGQFNKNILHVGITNNIRNMSASQARLANMLDSMNHSYQLLLVSGSNIKTINGASVLGSGNISISGTFQGLTDGPGTFTGKTLNFTRVNAGETALEYRTPSQVRSDIGAQGALTLTTTGSSGASTLIGNTLNIPQYSGGSGLTVGTSTITSGTSTRILYNNAGTLGEYTITGTGTTVAMSVAPAFTGVPTISGGTGPYTLAIGVNGSASAGNLFMNIPANVTAQLTSAASTTDNVSIGTGSGGGLSASFNTLVGSGACRACTGITRMVSIGSENARFLAGGGYGTSVSEVTSVGYAAIGEAGHDSGSGAGIVTLATAVGGHAGFDHTGPSTGNMWLGYKTGGLLNSANYGLTIQNAIWGLANSTLVDYTGLAQGRIGFYIANPTAKVHISNNTSTTNSFQIDNNLGQHSLTVTNTDRTYFGDGLNYGIRAISGNGLQIGTLNGGAGNYVQLVDNNAGTVLAQFLASTTYINSKATIGSNATPTALLMLAAGTATASTAPLKFNVGVPLTTPEAGAVDVMATNPELLYSTSTTTASRGYFAIDRIASTATSLTADAHQNTILITATGQTATLPTAVGRLGRKYTVKLTASGTGTVATTSSQTIDGSTTYSLSAQYKYVTIQSDNANWHIVANN